MEQVARTVQMRSHQCCPVAPRVPCVMRRSMTEWPDGLFGDVVCGADTGGVDECEVALSVFGEAAGEVSGVFVGWHACCGGCEDALADVGKDSALCALHASVGHAAVLCHNDGLRHKLNLLNDTRCHTLRRFDRSAAHRAFAHPIRAHLVDLVRPELHSHTTPVPSPPAASRLYNVARRRLR